MVTVYEYPHIGGLSTHMSLIKKGLLDNGYKVEILSISNVNRIFRLLICSLPCKIINIFNKDIGTLWFNSMNQVLLTLLIFVKILIGNRYNIINCQDVLSGKIALLLQRVFRVKVIFTVHGYFVRQAISNGILTDSSFVSKKYLDIEKKVYSKVNSIISVDSRIKEYIIECIGIDEKQEISVFKNFIDINTFRIESNNKKLREKWNIPTDKFILLCPRRLVPKNGVIYPLLSLTKLKNLHNVMLVYAGDGQERGKLEGLISEHQLKEKVLMLGDVEHQSIVELYNLCDVVIVPSVNSAGVEEATSISAIEGMASGKVVVASEIGGLKELIIHGHNGILVKEKDLDDLANNIMSIYLDSEKRSVLEKNARRTVEEHLSLEDRIHDYLKVFRGELK